MYVRYRARDRDQNQDQDQELEAWIAVMADWRRAQK